MGAEVVFSRRSGGGLPLREQDDCGHFGEAISQVRVRRACYAVSRLSWGLSRSTRERSNLRIFALPRKMPDAEDPGAAEIRRIMQVRSCSGL